MLRLSHLRRRKDNAAADHMSNVAIEKAEAAPKGAPVLLDGRGFTIDPRSLPDTSRGLFGNSYISDSSTAAATVDDRACSSSSSSLNGGPGDSHHEGREGEEAPLVAAEQQPPRIDDTPKVPLPCQTRATDHTT